ncbi:MAG: hypothetical protein ACPGWR_19365 [Ardenticatenaceae bacterium]
MNLLSTTLSDSMQTLGQSFLVAFYLPAFLFLLLHVYLLFPIWPPIAIEAPPIEEPSPLAGCVIKPADRVANQDVDLLAMALNTWICSKIADQEEASSATWFESLSDETTFLLGQLLLPLLGGLILLRLNGYLIQGAEGKYTILKEYLLKPFTRRNRERSKALYGELVQTQALYQDVSHQLWQSQSDQEKLGHQQTLVSLGDKIDQLHNQIEHTTPIQSLPQDRARICPTRFGNYYALAEEYSYKRYGADAVLFWTRLSELMQDEAPEHSERLIRQKTTLDFSLNLTFLCAILVIEAAATLIGLYFYDPPASWVAHWPLLGLLAIGIPLCVLLYYSSVGAVYVLGELIKNSFDRYRHLILTSFGLKIPDTISEEQIIWVRLAAFVRRGDEFYFPTEFMRDTPGTPA